MNWKCKIGLHDMKHHYGLYRYRLSVCKRCGKIKKTPYDNPTAGLTNKEILYQIEFDRWLEKRILEDWKNVD